MPIWYTIYENGQHKKQKMDTSKKMTETRPPRYSATFNACYGTSSTGMLLPCSIVDISWGGSRIELFTKHTVAAKATLELHIEIPGLDRRIVASFKCLWMHAVDRKGNEDGSIIGGCFTDISPADRTLLLDHAQKQTIANQAGKQKPHYTKTSLQYS